VGPDAADAIDEVASRVDDLEARLDDVETGSGRWEPIHADLESLRVAYPDLDEKASAAITATQESMSASFWAMRDADRPLSEEAWETLKTKYAAAVDAAEALKSAAQN
jgi:acetoin utilization deacetylase AcuC-like enzyme